MFKQTKTINWRDEYTDMIPWVEKQTIRWHDRERVAYALLLEHSSGWSEHLTQGQDFKKKWYEYPKGSYNWRERSDGVFHEEVTACFENPKEALQIYLEFGWNIYLSDTDFNFNPDLELGERYCLLEPAKQWLELHQWDLQYRCR